MIIIITLWWDFRRWFSVILVHWPTMIIIDSLINQINESFFSGFHIKIDQFQLSKWNFSFSHFLHFARKKPLGADNWPMPKYRSRTKNEERKNEQIWEACQIISWRITERIDVERKNTISNVSIPEVKVWDPLWTSVRRWWAESRNHALQITTLSWFQITIRYT